MLVGHEHRQREAVQQPLRRAFPVGLRPDAPRSARRRTAASASASRSSRHSQARSSRLRLGMLFLRSLQAAQLGVDLGGLVLQRLGPYPASVSRFCASARSCRRPRAAAAISRRRTAKCSAVSTGSRPASASSCPNRSAFSIRSRDAASSSRRAGARSRRAGCRRGRPARRRGASRVAAGAASRRLEIGVAERAAAARSVERSASYRSSSPALRSAK